MPGQNPAAAQQVITLQSLLQRNSQFQSNVSTNQSYLTQTDSTLSQVSSLLSNVQAAAVSVVGSTASDAQRQAVIQQINQAVQQLVNLGNTQFDGRYLFGGSDTGSPPFSIAADGSVQYSGNDSQLSSYSNLNSLFTTNVTGAAAFGAISQPVEGAAVGRAVTSQTSLADLNKGAGVAPGSIAVSNGTSASVIDLGQAATIGDVATLIRDHPPAGSALDVEVTPTGLTIQLAAGAGQGQSLSVSEVGQGTTARDLGILSPNGVGTGPLVGTALVRPSPPRPRWTTCWARRRQASSTSPASTTTSSCRPTRRAIPPPTARPLTACKSSSSPTASPARRPPITRPAPRPEMASRPSPARLPSTSRSAPASRNLLSTPSTTRPGRPSRPGSIRPTPTAVSSSR